jgi:hypothetical protein
VKRWALAELTSETALLAAARELKARGFSQLELHSPFPLEGADEVLGLRDSALPAVTLFAGLTGAAGAYVVQWYTDAVAWPLMVGGHPMHAAPAFVPIVFETGVLCAAAAAFFGALWGSGLPRLSHPVFDAPGFASATEGGFWVSIATQDGAELDRALAALRDFGAANVSTVEGEP